ncbi:hypothetical protein FISHEDRAFT_53124 [Fistulina hepatica ATCC 64428]|nr:hypothetical protein FISHEDRAFT_53124 [Fistulina hepatica ATCC 64428]
MSHALLLRLLLSPSFFSLHVALKYLGTYSDHIGITYYITRRLREFEIQELREVWGFICHLLITRPSKSRALECFIVDTAQQSTHIAMITLWFMQAYLKDLSNTPHDSKSFIICQRMLHKCHKIIFGDVPSPATGPYAGLPTSIQTPFSRRRVNHHALPAVIGMSIMLAGAPAMPELTAVMGEVAIEQGRAEEGTHELRGVEVPEDQGAPALTPSVSMQALPDSAPRNEDEEPDGRLSVESLPRSPRPGPREEPNRRRTVGPSQTVPALPLHLKDKRKPRLSDDPFGQYDNEITLSPYQSSPIFSARRTPHSAPVNIGDALLKRYDTPSQMQLLRGHYCRSEVQFLLALESISNRLLVIPRPARVSALRAELTALNHKLPAEVCVPMWCNSCDAARPPDGVPQPHHRVVRIPPGESVVLNSAERAPYLLIIELLGEDLDFDPSKRNNRDIVKKILVREHARHGASADLVPFGANESSLVPPVVTESPTTPTTALDDDDEMDLVEQVCGPEQSLLSRPIDLSDSIVLPTPPKNKELDMATWSRTPIASSSSFPITPHAQPSVDTFSQTESSSYPQNGHAISLDDYSERMRTAAIMLTQLNANLVREPTPTISTPTSNSVAAVSSPRCGSVPLTSTHMKLSYAEAAVIRGRIMAEMLALEEERMQRMKVADVNVAVSVGDRGDGIKTAEDEGIIRRELNKVDPSAIVVSESWAAKKSRIRHGSPYGHLANWDCVPVIVKTGADLRQEQLAVQLIHEFERIWKDENCKCWVRSFRILITGGTSGLVETITDAMSIHSIKKAKYARRLAEGRLGYVSLLDHFKQTYGDPSSAKFARAQRNFAKSLAGYSLVTYFLQVKDRHNGNIMLDRDGHLIHIDFGFILSNSPGNIGFEAAPFKLPFEYVEVLGGIDAPLYIEFKNLFREGFEAVRKHCDRIITLVELMQKDSCLPCFAALGEQTANSLRERFYPTLTHALIGEHVDNLINSSLGSNWTRLYDSYQYYSQSIL